jgi:Protein of unknown function (DUF1569)
MKTIFDPEARQELVSRIEHIHSGCRAQWGKMQVSQMLKHCILFDEWIQGTHSPEYYQSFLGKIFGKIALKSTLKPGEPMRRNMPAGRDFIVRDTSDTLQADKKKWAELIGLYDGYSNPNFIHDFFGKMTREEIGLLAYKHTDHHLRQFGG